MMVNKHIYVYSDKPWPFDALIVVNSIEECNTDMELVPKRVLNFQPVCRISPSPWRHAEWKLLIETLPKSIYTVICLSHIKFLDEGLILRCNECRCGSFCVRVDIIKCSHCSRRMLFIRTSPFEYEAFLIFQRLSFFGLNNICK